jgi:cysteinyl-tRNA synthetase
MTITMSTLLWLAAVVVAFVAGYYFGRQSAAAPQHQQMPEPIARPSADLPPLRPASPIPERRAAPPPAAAGPRPGDMAGGSPNANPNIKRTAAPPPAMAGGRAVGGREAAPKPPASAKSDDPDPEPAPRGRARAKDAAPLAAVKSWGYQLQHLDIARAAGSPYDLIVVDYSRDGSDEAALTRAEVERMQKKPGGGRRFVFAYLSIGEAESYRYYWQKRWTREKPEWLLGENPEWRENFTVCFWEPGWQKLICGSSDAYLDRIMAVGFDGVYIDKADAYYDIGQRHKRIAKARPDLEGDMVAFITRLSLYAKSKKPGFQVIMQNAEELLEHGELRDAIDAVAKEELLFGLSGPEQRNTKSEQADARQMLDLARRDGKPVLVVEYLDNQSRIVEAVRDAKALGYVLYVAPKDRELDRLNYQVLEA